MLKKIHVKFENSDEEASDDEYEDLNEVNQFFWREKFFRNYIKKINFGGKFFIRICRRN